MKRDPDCSLCGLCETADFVCLLGKGPKRSKVMIVGEAPGEREDDTGTPFVGRSGKLLTGILDALGVDRGDVYITNAVHCRPPDNRTPKAKEIKACKKWLLDEIKAVNPQFILMLGNVPLESLAGVKGIKKYRGKPIDVPGADLGTTHNKVYLFPAYHPSFALRDPRNEPVLQRDIKQFFEIVKRGGPRVEKGLSHRIVLTAKDFKEALEDIENNSLLSFDTETSGLDPFAPGAYITSLGIGTRKHQWCFPLQHTKGPLYNKFNLQRRRVRKLTKAVQGKKLVGHNGKFDSLFLRVIFGVDWWTDFDTMMAHYQVDENQYHGLDHLAAQHFGAIDYDIPLAEKHGFGPLDRHCEYLALDVFYTRKLYFILKKQLELDPPTARVFYGLTMPVARMYVDIEYNGVFVDPVELQAGYKYWKEIMDDRLAQLNKLVPDDRVWKDKKTKKEVRGINWGSPKQVAEVLFGRLKLKVLDRTPGGDPQVNESVLLRLAKLSPVPKLILEYREAQKNLGTFIEGWQKRCYQNRMHPSFKVHGTVTGRPSCEDPNLQQVPRDKRLRSLIRAPQGWAMVDADLSQAELRIAAEMSDDRELKLSYQTGVDVHTLTVQRIFGIMNPTKEERKKGKAINFGFIYGMGWRKFKDYARDNYGVDFTDGECKQIRKAFFRLYGDLPDWHKRQRRFANRNGYVRSLLGRKRRLPDAMLRGDDPLTEAKRANAERQAINSPVQSLASDINLAACVELWQELSPEYFRIVGTVHDAILMEVREDMLPVVLPRIKQAMEHPRLLKEWNVKMSVPIVSEVEVGPWGDAKVWEPEKIAA